MALFNAGIEQSPGNRDSIFSGGDLRLLALLSLFDLSGGPDGDNL